MDKKGKKKQGKVKEEGVKRDVIEELKKKVKENFKNVGEGEVQTRSETTGLRYFKTLDEAFSHAEEDDTVWKISFIFGKESVRLVKRGDVWAYTDMMAYIEAEHKKRPKSECMERLHRCRASDSEKQRGKKKAK
jgi:hypothetical protein